MTEKIPEGSRCTVTLECEVYYDGGNASLSVQLANGNYSSITVPRGAISNVRAPIQKPGAKVWHVGWEEEYEVVMHDARCGRYVLRKAGGALELADDDADVIPAAEARELRGETTDAPDPFSPETSVRPAAAPAEPIGTDLGAEDVVAEIMGRPAKRNKERGPNCDHGYLDAVCDAEGCLGELPF
jgi:hypothetical protein